MLDERDAGRLRDEGHGAGRARVRLEHVKRAVVERELEVEQAAGAEAAGERRGGARIFLFQRLGDRGRRQHAGAVAGVDACRLDVLEDRRDPGVFAVAERVDVELERALEVRVHERGAVGERSSGPRAIRMPRPPST